MRGREAAFDTALLAMILFLVLASPLALGAVHPQIVPIFEWLCLVLVLTFVLRAAWVPPVHGPAEGPDGGPSPRSRFTLMGHGLVRTGIEIPLLLFVALVAFQLLPIPPSILRLVSPATARLYESSLPGYGSPEGVDFSKVGSFLLGAGHDEVVGRILGSGGAVPVSWGTSASSLRPVSIYPYATLSRLMILLSLLGLFVVSVNTLRGRTIIDRVMRVVVLLGFGLSVFGIVQRLSWNRKIYWLLDVDPGASPFGPFINHNHFAAFLAMIVPVAAGMLMDEARKVAPRRGPGARPSAFALLGPEPFARMLLAAFVVGVMVGALVLSASRGATLALGASILAYGSYLAFRRGIGRREAVVALVLLVTAGAVSFWLGIGPLAHKLQAIGDVESEPSLLSRIVGWRTTIGIAEGHPLFGTGLGTFSESWSHVYPAGTSSVWHEAHNDYLQLLSETGVAGAVLFVAAFGIFAFRYLRPRLAGSGGDEPYAIHGIAVGIVAVAIHSIVDFPLQINACAILLVVMSSLLIAWRRGAEATSA